jgi:hypothetical protein
MTSQDTEERDLWAVLWQLQPPGGLPVGENGGDLLRCINMDVYSLTAPQLHVIIERCVVSGTVTKCFDVDIAGPPLLLAIMSRGPENVAPKKRPLMDDDDSAFESADTLAGYMTPPQNKKPKKAKQTKQESSSVKTCKKKPDRSLTAWNKSDATNSDSDFESDNIPSHFMKPQQTKKTKKPKQAKQKSSSVKTSEKGEVQKRWKQSKASVTLISARMVQALKDQAETGRKKCMSCYLGNRTERTCRTHKQHPTPDWDKHECVPIVKKNLPVPTRKNTLPKLPVGNKGRNLIKKYKPDCLQCGLDMQRKNEVKKNVRHCGHKKQRTQMVRCDCD